LESSTPCADDEPTKTPSTYTPTYPCVGMTVLMPRIEIRSPLRPWDELMNSPGVLSATSRMLVAPEAARSAAVKAAIESPLSVDEATKVVGCLRITGIESAAARAKAIEAARTRGATPTAQDKMLASVFSTRRLLDLVRHFTVFDAGTRKAARHQQYFCVRDTMKRIESAVDGKTQFIDVGGIVYHTQGSGKTLTAVMLAEQILQEVEAARIVLVTDRVDLNDQIYKNFRAAGHEPHQVESGRDLAEHLTRKSTRVLTTTIHKFPTVVQELQRMGQKMPERVFVLVDEAHRTQFGELAARMRQAFPSACFIGFTGTPVTRQGRDVFKVEAHPHLQHQGRHGRRRRGAAGLRRQVDSTAARPDGDRQVVRSVHVGPHHAAARRPPSEVRTPGGGAPVRPAPSSARVRHREALHGDLRGHRAQGPGGR